MPHLARTPGLDVVHDAADCPEALRHGDELEDIELEAAAWAINEGEARPCGACIGRAPSIGHKLELADG